MSDENIDEAPICKACNENPPDPAYGFPLCPKCRYLLIRRPFPKWINVFMVVVACLMFYSAIKFPIAFKAGVAQKAGKQAESMGNYSAAILEYQKILALFPESQEHKARLAVCLIKSGELQQAAEIIKVVKEQSLSKEVTSELNSLISNVQRDNNK